MLNEALLLEDVLGSGGNNFVSPTRIFTSMKFTRVTYLQFELFGGYFVNVDE
jgi:hypothetical protein